MGQSHGTVEPQMCRGSLRERSTPQQRADHQTPGSLDFFAWSDCHVTTGWINAQIRPSLTVILDHSSTMIGPSLAILCHRMPPTSVLNGLDGHSASRPSSLRRFQEAATGLRTWWPVCEKWVPLSSPLLILVPLSSR